MTSARAIITRPAAQAQAWVHALQAQGLQAVALPLIDIGPVDDLQAVQALHKRIDSFDVCMCVSSNAAHYFFASKKAVAFIDSAQAATKIIADKKPETLRFWATGAGTVRALQDCSVDPQQIDAPGQDAAQWDSEHLWHRVQAQITRGKKVLILRGEDVGTPSASRDWLAQQIVTKGGSVEVATVYQRRPPHWQAEQSAMAAQLAASNPVWVFSSSQAVAHLMQLLPAQNWSNARCVATHPRIAQAARDAGFGVVCMSRPGLDDVAITLKSLHA